MKYRRSQLVMIWFLPLIVIGGLFYPEFDAAFHNNEKYLLLDEEI